MKYTQGFNVKRRICQTFCVTDPTKRLLPSDWLGSKRLDVDQVIGCFPSDCYSPVCYIDVAAMLYNAVLCSMMSLYEYPVLFQIYDGLYDEIMSNNDIGTPNLNRMLYLKTAEDELR